jgi:serine/threonine-protein kinase
MTHFAEHLQAALGASYQVDRELTGGGMSRVYVATDRSLGRQVVVKVLPPELAAGVNRERFRREIQVAAQLQHPHIVPLLSAGEEGDLLWYTMPFIEGESLRTALERHKPFSVREVIRILHDVVDALAFAHQRGVVHRDIKPANILMQGAHALVTDFGVAKALSASLPMSGFTSGGIAIGTPAYMAPEQLAGDADADQRMDIYAVGLLAYELCTGSSPFASPSPRETLAAQLTRDPAPLYEVAADVPRSLSDLVMRCLEKDPNDRPQSADLVLQELDAMTMPLGMTPQGGGVEARRRKSHWLSVAAVAILFAVLAGVGYVVKRSRAVGEPPQSVVAAAGENAPNAPTAAGLNTPAVTPPPVATVITREDSLRIAEAVRHKLEAAKLRDSVATAKFTEQTQRRMFDSIIAVNSGKPITLAGPRRLLIAEPPQLPQWPEAFLLGRAVADSLRRMLVPRSKQYQLIDQDSVRAILARTRNVGEVSRALKTDLLLSIKFTALPADSAMVMIQVWDLSAASPHRTRADSNRVASKSNVLANLDDLLLSTLTNLDEMSHAPRRTAAREGPEMP